ncbi:DUF397 domain-containing protein [Spirillospora albida]|uniref:DUF397 domain-containing protein n=1 Tax=Spirillospora albida TaxID=58123 RepID=UPI000A04CB79|nr:DUF397 domain-containing protein [Spirillospora albida]
MDTANITWRTSRHSIGNGGECVEIGTWRKSSRSADETDCVEVAAGEALVLARDSKDPDGTVLAFGSDAWAAFLGTVKSGRLDLRSR